MITEIQNSAKGLIPEEAIGSPSIGDVVRQGDLYLVCVDRVTGEKTDHQLAPGNTQGSRHVAEGDCTVVKHSQSLKNIPDVLIGPGIICHGDTRITHPEHRHKILPKDTCWIVVYQRVHAEEVRRVQD